QPSYAQPVYGAPGSASAPTTPCLTKTYPRVGIVAFEDTCTQESAINNTEVTAQVPAKAACLTKENRDGAVLFKDVCTNEWAMNPPSAQTN
ncbi:MAG: hypothetical protein C5B56_10675, partial [Proteobacteria bacterium]